MTTKHAHLFFFIFQFLYFLQILTSGKLKREKKLAYKTVVQTADIYSRYKRYELYNSRYNLTGGEKESAKKNRHTEKKWSKKKIVPEKRTEGVVSGYTSIHRQIP